MAPKCIKGLNVLKSWNMLIFLGRTAMEVSNMLQIAYNYESLKNLKQKWKQKIWNFTKDIKKFVAWIIRRELFFPIILKQKWRRNDIKD